MPNAKQFFNRGRPCLGCGETAYPANVDTVVKRTLLQHTGGFRESYFCDEDCYRRWCEINEHGNAPPLYGEALGDGFAHMAGEDALEEEEE